MVQPNAVGPSLKQLRANLLLHPADGTAQSRLGDMQLRRRLGNMLGLGHGSKVNQIIQFHILSSGAYINFDTNMLYNDIYRMLFCDYNTNIRKNP